MHKFNVEINYHQISYSGCSLIYANTISKKREYIDNPECTCTTIPILPHFKINWIFAGTLLTILPLTVKYQHLTIDNEIDYESFISLN